MKSELKHWLNFIATVNINITFNKHVYRNRYDVQLSVLK